MKSMKGGWNELRELNMTKQNNTSKRILEFFFFVIVQTFLDACPKPLRPNSIYSPKSFV
jgi:hypothetical protein